MIQNFQDLEFQPQINPSTFKTPFLRAKQVVGSFVTLGIVIFLLISTFITILLSVNYFNIVSLSRLYPDLFFDLPHQTFEDQVKINNQVLSSPQNYNKESGNWIIVAEFFSLKENTVYVKYKGQIPSLKKTKDMKCTKLGEKIQTKDGYANSIEAYSCNDLLSRKNKGKRVVIDYTIQKYGDYEITRIQLE